MTVIYLNDNEIKNVFVNDLYFHKRGLMQTATGYGSKLTTRYKIKLTNNKTYRVYCHCFSNVGSLYIVKNKQRIVIKEWQISDNLKDTQQ